MAQYQGCMLRVYLLRLLLLRMFDISADKQLPHLLINKENACLGQRGYQRLNLEVYVCSDMAGKTMGSLVLIELDYRIFQT